MMRSCKLNNCQDSLWLWNGQRHVIVKAYCRDCPNALAKMGFPDAPPLMVREYPND